MSSKQLIPRRRYLLFIIGLCLILSLLMIYSFRVGRFSKLSVTNIPRILINEVFPLFEEKWTPADKSDVLNLRFPRIIAAVIVGASLAISGATYQALFSNPIASSDSLGVSSSAAFGAVLGFILNYNTIYVKLFAFAVGCMSVFSVFFIASKMSNRNNLTLFLILIGMVISSLSSALLAIMKYIADPIDQLPKIT